MASHDVMCKLLFALVLKGKYYILIDRNGHRGTPSYKIVGGPYEDWEECKAGFKQLRADHPDEYR